VSEALVGVVDRLAHTAHSVASALAHMHARRVLHRDVKAENVFVIVDSNERVASCALGDFGESLQVWTVRHSVQRETSSSLDGFAAVVRAAEAHVIEPRHARVRRARGCGWQCVCMCARVGRIIDECVQTRLRYDAKIDVWAYGMLLFELLTA
jgi:serine/threonine protein kinase